jgi:hypothetical protein
MDVQDATAALKGMLGIGGISNTLANTTPMDAGGVVAVSTAAATTTTSTTNTTTNTATGSPDPNPTGIISTTTTHTNNPNNNNMASPSKKKKKKKAKPPKTPSSNPTTTGKKNNHNNNKPEVFAWSAFQSSPDASKLPIPEFSPQHTTNIYHANPSTFIVDADDAGAGATTSTRTSTVTDAPKGTLSPSSSLAAPPTAPSLHSTTAASSPPQPSPSILKPEDETLTSSTGINLAAKLKTAASITPPSTVTILPATAEATTQLSHVPPPYAMQYNYDYNTSVGDGGVGGAGSPHMASPPPSLLFPSHSHQQQYQQQQQYAFVSVQVPPLHMMNPQRTLLVNTPAGPLPIVIPPHYPPGSWIQVPVVQPAYPQSQPPPPPYPYSSMMP